MNLTFNWTKYKSVIYTFIALWTCNGFCQVSPSLGTPTASISADMPNISPASPTVASLMKFEEVPVNNYTGIPDVSIPLYSIESLSKDLPVNISLKYHPSSIAIKEVASYTGLGWNLIAGGTISRTVRGIPDEITRHGGNDQATVPRRIGIYNNNVPNGNNFYEVLGLLGTAMTPTQLNMVREYIWDAFEKGYYDSEHDLYQYNFMGHTGRFYVRKNIANGNLEPVKLDNDNSIKIVFNYSYSYNAITYVNTYDFQGFTLYDDKGYKYIFTEKEETVESTTNTSVGFKSPAGSFSPENYTYISAYHLTSILDNNDKEIVKITYQTATERTKDNTYLFNNLPYPNSNSNIFTWLTTTPGSGLGDAQIFGMLPKSAGCSKIRTVTTKKILELQVVNKAKISFGILKERGDSNMMNYDAPQLTSMTVKNWYGEVIKQYSFVYDYATITPYSAMNNAVSRLILSEVRQSNTTNTEDLVYTLHYKNQNVTVQGVITDYWGYFKAWGPGRDTDPDYCTTGVLRQMDLPTGGHIVFDYGPNTYSYIGDQEVTDFSIEQYEEEDPIYIPVDPVTGSGKQPIVLQPQEPTTVSFMFEAVDSPVSYTLIHNGNSHVQYLDSAGINGINDGNASGSVVEIDKSASYTLEVAFADTTATTIVKARRFGHILPLQLGEWLYGGGIRINKISYFDVTDLENATPVKEKHFNYNFFDDTHRSSGALAFPKPLYEYTQGRLAFSPDIWPVNPLFGIGYNTTTTTNNLLSIRTQGSDVGYKNVTVWETGNGKSEYTYTSPIDYPETNYTIGPPFMPSINFDYKRGLLINEKNYSGSEGSYNVINEIIYDYPVEDMDEVIVMPSLRAYVGNPSPMAPNFQSYSSFADCVNNTGCSSGWGSPYYDENNYLSFAEIFEAYGWPKLKKKTTREYFYPAAGANPDIMATVETFDYNPDNKKLKKQTLVNAMIESASTSILETFSTEYTYDTNDAGRNRIGMIQKIQALHNGAVTDTKEIVYSNTGWTANSAYLPKTIMTAKGTNSTENRLQFTKHDEYSNPLEAKMESGAPTVYIWGYNNSLPIAIIENAPATISQSLIDAAKNASNSYTNASPSAFDAYEAALLSALNNLRNSLPATAMCTTYTHRPLIGVSTATDARGYRIIYYYDSFGRLKQVKDMAGKILSENDYNYKMSTP